jgi:hypothetical protein
MAYIIGSFMSIAIPLLHIIAVYRYTEWKHWSQYYSTIVFAIAVNFFASMVTYNYPLWIFHKTFFIPNHTLTDIMIAFIILPSTVLLYLTFYPYKSRWIVKLTYIIFWVSIDSAIEYIFSLCGIITYHNNWSFKWSILLWGIMFPVFSIHHTKSLWAWLLCLGFSFIVVWYFHIPMTKLK